MSILIKGMDMPTSCRACHLKMNCDDCEGLECVCVPLHQQIGYLDDLLTDKRRDDCPLVPVPPHGKLIDADTLNYTMLYKENWMSGTGVEALAVWKKDIDACLIIIEAEEG